MPIVDSENGDLRSMPFPGSISQQPYMSMQVIIYIKEQYKKALSQERKRMLAKTQGPSAHGRRPVRRPRR